MYAPNTSTIYQSLSLSDGEKNKTRPKALNPREKLKKDIENQLGITITQ